jgi:hypothetical protein
MLPLQSPCVHGSELDAPQADRLAADGDASFGEQVFDISVAEIESEVKPDSIADYVRWESMASISIHAPILSRSVT